MHNFFEIADSGMIFSQKPPIYFPKEMIYLSKQTLRSLDRCINFFIIQNTDDFDAIRFETEDFHALFQKTINQFLEGSPFKNDEGQELFRVLINYKVIVLNCQNICWDVEFLINGIIKDEFETAFEVQEKYFKDAYIELDDIKTSVHSDSFPIEI